MTGVPLAPALVIGLLNLRGQVVTVSDLRLRFGLPERPAGLRPTTVVLRTSAGLLGLLVDRMDEVIDVDLDRLERPREDLLETGSDLIAGVLDLAGERLLVLDPARYFATWPDASSQHRSGEGGDSIERATDPSARG